MASGRIPLPPFLLVKPAFGFATSVTVPLLSVSKCLCMGGRDSAIRVLFIPPRILALYFRKPFFFSFLIDHNLLNAQIHFSKKNQVCMFVCVFSASLWQGCMGRVS